MVRLAEQIIKIYTTTSLFSLCIIIAKKLKGINMKSLLSYTRLILFFSLILFIQTANADNQKKSIFYSATNYTTNYTADDVLSFKRIGQVIASPNGKNVVFTVMQAISTQTGKEWEYLLYLKNSEGKVSVLSSSLKQLSSPMWSPDGMKISYLAKGKKFQSIWIISLLSNKKAKLFECNNDIKYFRWSPDGKYIAFVTDDQDKKINTKLEPKNIVTSDINTRIYFIPATQSIKIAKPLTPATYSISQSYPDPLLDAGFDWSPDSQSIVFSYQSRPEATYYTEAKIAVLDLKTRKIITIPYTEQFTGQQPIYSLDGKWIAFRSTSRDITKLINNPVIYNQICVTNTTKLNNTHCLSNTFNENPVIIGWNKANDSVFVLDWYKTIGLQIYTLNLNQKDSAKLLYNINGFLNPLSISLNQDHIIFGFAYETVTKPPEAFISSSDNFKLTQISNINSNIKKTLGNMENVSWKSSDGITIDGLLITPYNYNNKNKYPLLVTVHGGPAGAWAKRYLGGCEEYGEAFVPDCLGHLASLGFVILQPNPRGSTGYGKNFRMANFADLGGGDYRDMMAGVDYLIKRGVADPEHLAIFGWSYGGYLTAWAISQSNRFKAAIDGDGLTNFVSFSGTSDIPWYLSQYLGNYYWDNINLYLQRSPISYVKNINTPLLIFHGENDIRVPLTQSYELYSALQIQKKPVKMFISPDTDHVPNNANIIYKNIIEIDHWLKQAL